MKEKKHKHNPASSNQTKNKSTLLAALLFLSIPLATHAASTFNYQLLEDFPGISGMKAGTSYTDMLGMVNALYKFGIWTVGIAALLMLVIGGFMYMTSAGNTSRVGSAKGVIGDALLGILAALGAYLLLYVINPDLTKLNLKLIQVQVQSGTGGSGAGGGTGNGNGNNNNTGNGTCTPVLSGPCSVENLQNTCFASVATQASSICNKESGGTEDMASLSDLCQHTSPAFSYGLFQINLTVHNIGGNKCEAPSGAFTATNYDCTVKDQTRYNACVAAAKTASTNISTACSIYNGAKGNKWNQWGANAACGF